jgi:cytochrome c oxidase subunit 2
MIIRQSIALAVLTLVTAQVPKEQVIQIRAKRFEYEPSTLRVKVNTPVVLEITSLDRKHGFEVPAFNLRAEIKPGEITRIRFVPDKVGTFPFHCNVFCGDGHEDMSGEIIVSQ